MYEFIYKYIYVYTIVGGGVSNGIILQRFPEKDWPDTPFIEGIEWVKLFSSRKKSHYISYLIYDYFIIVLSTTRMGPINRETRTTVLCLNIDRHRRKSTLLRLHVF